MSHTETHIGKLRKIDIPTGYSKEDWCREKCQDNGIPTIPEHYDNWEETLKYHLNLFEVYFFVNEEIWEIFDHIELDEDKDINKLEKNGDGTISFVLQFYNGGTCLSECIEEELELINK
jgi:hypothetical protein